MNVDKFVYDYQIFQGLSQSSISSNKIVIYTFFFCYLRDPNVIIYVSDKYKSNRKVRMQKR